MSAKKNTPKDSKLKAFIQAGGRAGAETDFNALLKRAVKPKKDSRPSDKTK